MWKPYELALRVTSLTIIKYQCLIYYPTIYLKNMNTKFITTSEFITCHILKNNTENQIIYHIILYNNLLDLPIYEAYYISNKIEEFSMYVDYLSIYKDIKTPRTESETEFLIYGKIVFFLNDYFEKYSDIHNEDYPSILDKSMFLIEYTYEGLEDSPASIKTSTHSLFDSFLLDYHLASNNWGVTNISNKQLPIVEGTWNAELIEYRFCWKYYGPKSGQDGYKPSDNVFLDNNLEFIFELLQYLPDHFIDVNSEPMYQVVTDLSK